MATLSVAARNAALDAVIALGESPGGTFSGIAIFFVTAGFSTLGSIVAPVPGWAPAAAGSKALLAPLVFAMTGSGTVARCQMNARDGTLPISINTVGGPGSGLEVEFSPDAAVVAGEIYQINELTLEVA